MDSQPHILVMYIFSDSDPEAANNLRYFVQHAVREGDGCEYVIVVQQGRMKGREGDAQEEEPMGAGGHRYPESYTRQLPIPFLCTPYSWPPPCLLPLIT